jgi:uncharacterized membrane protein HdeD (DUF308 family)
MDEVHQETGLWWLFLLTGILWILISLVVLQFDADSVATVGVLVGIVFLFAGANEFAIVGTKPGWKWLHAILGVLFMATGIWAFIHPFKAFATLASVLGLILILKGTLDIMTSVMTKAYNDLWGLQLAAGIIEILLAFWISASPAYLGQNFEKRAILIIIFVGISCLMRGIGEIVLSFGLRKLHRQSAAA